MTRLRTAVIVPVALAAVSCSRPAPQPSVQNAAEATIANLDAEANALEAKAADQVNAAGADELANAQAAFDAGEATGNTR